MKIETEWKLIKYAGVQCRIRAEYGFQTFPGQDPYWSVTATIDRQGRNGRWEDHSGGCIHDAVAKYFPKLRDSIRWHLCAVPSGPTHYIANALYWWEHVTGGRIMDAAAIQKHGSSFEAALSAFKHSIVFGALEDLGDDTLPKLSAARSDVRAWLEARLPRLIKAMKIDIDAIDPSLWPTGAP